MIPNLLRVFAAGALILPAAIIITTLGLIAGTKIYEYLEGEEAIGK
jgi:hypothetical protein